jgi:hypothetical protein
VPPLSTLLANATRQVLCDRGPLLSPSGLDKRQDKLIFLLTPWPFDQLWVEYLLPSVEALDVCPTAEALCDFLPVLAFEFIDGHCELSILLRGPVTFVSSILVLGWASLVNVRVLQLTTLDDRLCRHVEFLLPRRRLENVVINLRWGLLSHDVMVR